MEQMEWVAVYDFYPTDSRHVALREGDIVLEVQQQGNGWAYGHNKNTDKYGAFPSNYVDNNLYLEVTASQHVPQFHDVTKKESHAHPIPKHKLEKPPEKELKTELVKEITANKDTDVINQQSEPDGILPTNSINKTEKLPNQRLKDMLESHFRAQQIKPSLSKFNINSKEDVYIDNEVKLPKNTSANKVNGTDMVLPKLSTETQKPIIALPLPETVYETDDKKRDLDLTANNERKIIETNLERPINSFRPPTKEAENTNLVTLGELDTDDLTKADELSEYFRNDNDYVDETNVKVKSEALTSTNDDKLKTAVKQSPKTHQTAIRIEQKQRLPKHRPRLPGKRRNFKLNFNQNVTAGILGGLLAGGVLYILLVFSFSYSYGDAGWVTFPFVVLTGTGLALSTYVRCLILLTIPSLFTGKGRAMFLTLIFGLLLGGPVVNILHNGNQMSKSIACTTALIKEQSLLLARQLGEPIEKVAKKLRFHFREMKKLASGIIDALDPVKSALQDMQDGVSKAANALKRIYQECDSGSQKVLQKCKTGMTETRKKCIDFVGRIDPTRYIFKAGATAINWAVGVGRSFVRLFGKRRRREIDYLRQNQRCIELKEKGFLVRNFSCSRHKRAVLDFICAPLSVTGICDIFKLGKFICKPFDTIGGLADKASQKIFESLRELTNLFVFDIETDFHLVGGINATKTASEIVVQVSRDLAEKTNFVTSIAKTVSKVMILSLIFLIVKSILYIRKYNSKDYFENKYITKEFMKFDMKCQKAGKTHVLPLKPRELRKYVVTTSIILSMAELKKSSHGFITVLLHLTVTVVVIVFDYVTYYVLLLAKRYGEINVSVEGTNVVKTHVEGNGLIASFLRYLTEGLEVDTVYDVDFNITKCLPDSKEPNANNIFIFFVLYFVAFLLVCFQAYGNRLQRTIASYFYPEREFERILWLHEKIRHKRMTGFSWLMQRLKSNKKEKNVTERITLRSCFYYTFPRLAAISGCCSPVTVTCLCCGMTNDGVMRFHVCQNNSCDAVYCMICYGEMKNKCYRCKKRQTH